MSHYECKIKETWSIQDLQPALLAAVAFCIRFCQEFCILNLNSGHLSTPCKFSV